MKILALDFSSVRRCVAVLNDNDTVAHEIVDASTGRDMKPFALIEAALCKAGLEREDIGCIAVGIGPGSYTGIRVAISLAQGWQLATGVKLLGVSSVECIAAQAVKDGVKDRFNVVIDALRGEFYVSGYEVVSGVLTERSALKLATSAEVTERLSSGELVIGPEVTKWFPGGRDFFPGAGMLATLAAGRKDFVSGQKLEPIYLRETTFVKAPPQRNIQC